MYDSLFNNIENNLREMGLGDVAVNKKMKDLNKIFYDILLKIDRENVDVNKFKINKNLIIKYFEDLKLEEGEKISLLESYFDSFFNFCFELKHDNVINNIKNFKF